jgi:hypothetical protein
MFRPIYRLSSGVIYKYNTYIEKAIRTCSRIHKGQTADFATRNEVTMQVKLKEKTYLYTKT